VPLREVGLEPWEIMISESQERMVAVVAPERLADVRAVCARWELPCTPIGEITDRAHLRAIYRGDVAGDIPARFLTDDCPRYEVAQRPRAVASATAALPAEPADWVYEQYDQLVGSRTVRRPGLDAAVLRVDGTRGVAVSLDGPRRGERDPFRAGYDATIEAALNVACAGGRPLALTDCLNFGNPERAEIGWELAQAIDGIAQAARELGIPVVSGNVSLYNETGGRPIPPTPVVGCVGLVPDVRRVSRGWRPGDRVYFAAGEGPELVRFAYDAARDGALVTDSTVAEVADWCGVPAGFERPDGPGVLVALPGRLSAVDVLLVELGTV
jgi:phosphoribosylformylglycinamidine synthase subunit PurL